MLSYSSGFSTVNNIIHHLATEHRWNFPLAIDSFSKVLCRHKGVFIVVMLEWILNCKQEHQSPGNTKRAWSIFCRNPSQKVYRVDLSQWWGGAIPSASKRSSSSTPEYCLHLLLILTIQVLWVLFMGSSNQYLCATLLVPVSFQNLEFSTLWGRQLHSWAVNLITLLSTQVL